MFGLRRPKDEIIWHSLFTEVEANLSTAKGVHLLSTEELLEEATSCLVFLSKIQDLENPQNEPLISRVEKGALRWLGNGSALAGIPICFSSFSVGMAASIGGLALSGWSEWLRLRERTRSRGRRLLAVKIADRRDAILYELRKRPLVDLGY